MDCRYDHRRTSLYSNTARQVPEDGEFKEELSLPRSCFHLDLLLQLYFSNRRGN
jgi:hypothetical protein